MSQIPDNDDQRIAVAVAEPYAKELVIQTIRDLGVTPIPLDEPGDLLAVSRFCAGSVCDMRSPQIAARTVQAVRAADPAHPVLLIVLADQEPASAQLSRGDMGIRYCSGKHRQRFRQCLRTNIEWLTQYHPVDALLNTMMNGVGSPSKTTSRFLEWSIRAVHAGGPQGVSAGACDLGVSTRTLARHLRDDRMPSPIELHGWAKLLAVCHRSDLNKTSLAASARTFNIDPGRLYQLRRRLLRKTTYGGVKSDRPVFPFILQAFRERCSTLRPGAVATMRRAGRR